MPGSTPAGVTLPSSSGSGYLVLSQETSVRSGLGVCIAEVAQRWCRGLENRQPETVCKFESCLRRNRHGGIVEDSHKGSNLVFGVNICRHRQIGMAPRWKRGTGNGVEVRVLLTAFLAAWPSGLWRSPAKGEGGEIRPEGSNPSAVVSGDVPKLVEGTRLESGKAG